MNLLVFTKLMTTFLIITFNFTYYLRLNVIIDLNLIFEKLNSEKHFKQFKKI